MVQVQPRHTASVPIPIPTRITSSIATPVAAPVLLDPFELLDRSKSTANNNRPHAPDPQLATPVHFRWQRPIHVEPEQSQRIAQNTLQALQEEPPLYGPPTPPPLRIPMDEDMPGSDEEEESNDDSDHEEQDYLFLPSGFATGTRPNTKPKPKPKPERVKREPSSPRPPESPELNFRVPPPPLQRNEDEDMIGSFLSNSQLDHMPSLSLESKQQQQQPPLAPPAVPRAAPFVPRVPDLGNAAPRVDGAVLAAAQAQANANRQPLVVLSEEEKSRRATQAAVKAAFETVCSTIGIALTHFVRDYVVPPESLSPAIDFSSSRVMESDSETMLVERDHATFVNQCSVLLTPRGTTELLTVLQYIRDLIPLGSLAAKESAFTLFSDIKYVGHARTLLRCSILYNQACTGSDINLPKTGTVVKSLVQTLENERRWFLMFGRDREIRQMSRNERKRALLN